MKKIVLVGILGILLALATPVLAVNVPCEVQANISQIVCNFPEITNCSQLSNFTILYNSTIVGTTDFGTLVNNSVWGSLANYTDIKNRLTLCEANMSQAQYNASRIELFEYVQRDLIACQGNISQKENQINLFIGNISAIQAQCDASKVGMVTSAEHQATTNELKECNRERESYTPYLIGIAIGAAGLWWFKIKPGKRTEEEMEKRTGDAIRQKLQR